MAAVPEQVVKATRAAQGVMREHVPGLQVDGRWGSYTDGAYAKIDSATKRVIDAVLSTFNQSVSTVKSAFKAEKVFASQTLGSDWIDENKARATLERAANAVKIPYSALKEFLDLEPAKKRTADGVYYNVKSRNGSYKGLFQFDSASWESAQKYLNRARIGVDLGNFEANVYDPWLNSIAAAAYARFNEDEVRRRTGSKKVFTGNDYYTMHNQGAGGYIRIVGGGSVENAKGQSQAALDRIKTIRA